MHTNPQGVPPLGSGFGTQLSCPISKRAYSGCAVSAGKIQDFHSNTILPNKQGSLFGLGGFRKARYRTFTEKDRTFRQNKSLKIISRKFKKDIDI